MNHTSAIAALLLFTGCAEDRYQWNLTHAEVTARPPLPRADLEEIIRVVTHATVQPIGSIYRSGVDRVSVTAAGTVGYVEDFQLQKVAGQWKIISHEQQLDR
jgi:hypothetical protein